MESDAAVDDQRGRLVVHAIVHLLVHQPEGDRLVADQRLVVALGVRDVLLAVPTVDQRPDHLLHVPIFVAAVLQEL